VDESITIREYASPDRDAVMALAPRLAEGVAPWRDPAAVLAAVTGWVRDSLDHADADDRAVRVAARGSKLVGVVTVATRRHFAGELDAYVGELVVADGHDRNGIGRRLMQAAEEWGRRRGLQHLTLETGAANTAARAFYRSLGYREEEVRLTQSITARPPPP
jgi:ribosomal protein S18 acetylase RimI-like enzyme